MKCLSEAATITVLSNVFKFLKQRSGEFRAGDRPVDLGGQCLKLSTETAVLKRVSLLIGGGKHVDWGSQAPLGTGHE